MYEVLLVAYLLVALALVGLVLIQHGKGADMGASFGAGASNTMFGSSGAGNFLTRSTAILAVIFFVISLILGNLSSNQGKDGDEFSDLSVSEQAAEASVISEQPVSDIPVVDAAEKDIPVVDAAEKDIPQVETVVEATEEKAEAVEQK